MSLSLYMDVHIPRPITLGLRQRGVDILTAQEDRGDLLGDGAILDRAAELGRVVFTFDSDFLKEAAARQTESQSFAGVIALQGEGINLGQCLADLELICKVTSQPTLSIASSTCRCSGGSLKA